MFLKDRTSTEKRDVLLYDVLWLVACGLARSHTTSVNESTTHAADKQSTCDQAFVCRRTEKGNSGPHLRVTALLCVKVDGYRSTGQKLKLVKKSLPKKNTWRKSAIKFLAATFYIFELHWLGTSYI